MNRASLRADRPALGVPVCMTVLAQDVGSGFPLRRERRRVGGTYDVWVGVVGHPQWSGFPLRREWRGNLLTIDRRRAGRPQAVSRNRLGHFEAGNPDRKGERALVN